MKFAMLGANTAHHAAVANDLDTLNRLPAKELEATTHFGFGLAHFAVYAENSNALQWVQHHYQRLLKAKDHNHATVVHHAAKNPTVFKYMLFHMPELVKELWVEDKNGNTPEEWGLSHPSPSRLIEQCLFEATLIFIKNQKDLQTLHFLTIFAEQWQTILFKANKALIQQLHLRFAALPNSLQDIFTNNTLRLAIFYCTPHETINKHSLSALISWACKEQIPKDRRRFFRVPEKKPSTLVTILLHFNQQLTSKPITEQQLDCLVLILNDVQRGIIPLQDLQDQCIVETLNHTHPVNRKKTSAQSQPHLPSTSFSSYLAEIKAKLTTTPLAQGIKTNMEKFIFPALECLLAPEQIIEKVKRQHQRSYRLNTALVLGISHCPVSDELWYQQLFERLITDFCTAAHSCTDNGHWVEFFKIMNMEGELQQRVAAVTQYASTLRNSKPFATRMDYYIRHELIPYFQLMETNAEEIPLETALEFINTRHQNESCLTDPNFASTGKITRSGIERYLVSIGHRPSLLLQTITETIEQLEQEALAWRPNFRPTSLWPNFSKRVEKEEIAALRALHLEVKRHHYTQQQAFDYLNEHFREISKDASVILQQFLLKLQSNIVEKKPFTMA